jgi:hypothetical protein
METLPPDVEALALGLQDRVEEKDPDSLSTL